MGGVADRKIYTRPSPTCYHVKFGSSVTNAVHINRRKPSKPPRLWSAGSPAAPSLYVLSRQIWKGTPTIGNTWVQPPCGRSVSDPLQKHLSPHVFPAEFCRSMSNGTSVIMKLLLLLLLLRYSYIRPLLQWRQSRACSCE